MYEHHLRFTVTVASKCRVERGAREPIDYWKEYFTAVSLGYIVCMYFPGKRNCYCMWEGSALISVLMKTEVGSTVTWKTNDMLDYTVHLKELSV